MLENFNMERGLLSWASKVVKFYFQIGATSEYLNG